MREIKFRAWHKNTNEMYEVFSFCHAFTKVCVGIGTASEKIPNNLFEPLMQFTGLKDMAGKKIYEGDICNYLLDETPFSDEPDLSNYKNKTGVVKFKDFRWLFESENSDDFIVCLSQIKVIGNIHENPELLTQHKN